MRRSNWIFPALVLVFREDDSSDSNKSGRLRSLDTYTGSKATGNCSLTHPNVMYKMAAIVNRSGDLLRARNSLEGARGPQIIRKLDELGSEKHSL